MQATAQIIIIYSSSIKVDAGWRTVNIKARAERVSPAMCVVREVLEIDGEAPSRSQSRTGAKRQAFNGTYWAQRQVGAKKRIGSCEIVG